MPERTVMLGKAIMLTHSAPPPNSRRKPSTCPVTEVTFKQFPRRRAYSELFKREL